LQREKSPAFVDDRLGDNYTSRSVNSRISLPVFDVIYSAYTLASKDPLTSNVVITLRLCTLPELPYQNARGTQILVVVNLNNLYREKRI